MRQARPAALVVSALLSLVLVACSDDSGGPRVVGEDGSEIDITTETATPEESEVSPTVISPGDTATSTTTSTPTEGASGDDDSDDDSDDSSDDEDETPSPTPDSTGTPTPTRTPGSGGSTATVPYSTDDLRAAVEAEGEAFDVIDTDDAVCATSVPATTFQAGGSTWALWVYPDGESREDEFRLDDDRLESRVDGCELPTGFNYFNANLVLALVSSDGTTDAVRDAFLSLGSGSGSDEDDGGDADED